jgi:hypothetical protein
VRDSERRKALNRVKAVVNEFDPYGTASGMLLALEGRPQAQRLETDRTSGHATVADDEGIPMPAVSDPTGEAAIHPDRAASDLRKMNDLLLRMRRDADELSVLQATYRVDGPTADRLRSEADRAKVDNKERCESCARVNHWSPVHRRSTVKGNLPRPMPLCRSCYHDVLATGKLPSLSDVRARAEGRKLWRRAG